MKKFFKFLLFCLSLGVFFCFLAGASLLGLFYYFGAGLPDYQQLKFYEPPVVTRLYANDGQLFGEYAAERRVFIPVETIPLRLKRAFLSAEDKHFYTHPGIDVFGIFRAVIVNVSKVLEGRRLVGASTITQQVARHFLLSETSTLVSFERKFKEAILTFRIEHAYTKDHILELYLNEIYLGNRSYGVAAAAMNYFRKSLEELSIAEVAYLAALPKAPSRYHPEKNQAQAVARRNWVIERMFEDGYITEEEAIRAKAEPLVMASQEDKQNVSADFFAEEVRRTLLHKYGETGLYRSGLVVRTTLDPHLQNYANKALRHGLEAYDRRHGWRGPLASFSLTKEALQKKEWVQKIKEVPLPDDVLQEWEKALVLKVEAKGATLGLMDGHLGNLPLEELKWARRWISTTQMGPSVSHPKDVLAVGDVILVEKGPPSKSSPRPSFRLRQIPKVSGGLVAMDPHTGKVLALTGGYSFEMSQFNRATQALRQLGSSFKTFVYLCALEKGLTPSSMLVDAPLVIDLGWNLGVYRPRNYNKKFMGPLTLRRALELSRNTVTIRIAHEIIGVDALAEVGNRFGLYENLSPYLAMALGAGESTLLKLTTAYCSFVNGGKRTVPLLIDRIQDRHGRTVHLTPERKCMGCTSGTWHEQEVPRLVDDRPVIVNPAHAYQIVSILEGAVHRGTSKRALALKRPVAGKTGTSNEFRNAFYVGFTPDLVVGVYVGFDDHAALGEEESGARAALPIFVEFMGDALKNVPPIPFRIPPGINLIRVNPYTGKRITEHDRVFILEAFKGESTPEDTPSSSTEEESSEDASISSGGLY